MIPYPCKVSFTGPNMGILSNYQFRMINTPDIKIYNSIPAGLASPIFQKFCAEKLNDFSRQHPEKYIIFPDKLFDWYKFLVALNQLSYRSDTLFELNVLIPKLHHG